MIFDIPRQLISELQDSINAQRDQDLSQSKVKSLLEAAIKKCNLVSREEFDVQTEVLQRTREKLEALEKKFAELNQD